MGPIGGALLAAALQGIFGIGSTIAQNQYNSPKAMKRRLRAAGLPLSYMYRGNVATQSEAPKLSIDPTMGVEKKMSLDIQRDVAEATIPKVKADTARLDIANDIQAGIRDWLKNKGKKSPLGPSGTNQEINLQIEQAEKLAVMFTKEHEQRLKQLQRLVENTLFSEGVPQEERRQGLAKIKQQIKNMVSQSGLMDQLSEIREFDAFLNSTVTENINSLPKWAQALTAIILKAYSLKN